MRIFTLFVLLVGCGGSEAPQPAAQPAAAPAAKAEAKAEAKPAAKPAAAKAKGAKAGAKAAGGAGDVDAGKTVYGTYCQACHQVDGTGMNGMLAGNFVKDKARLAKPDEELLTSIRDGVTGKIGTMPPWKGTLSDEDMRNVLAYIRATYGG
jgi:mono/diheme cytochrome c family protein